ncbi:MAG: hypothetical protein JNL21_22120 [Myxococcales bacterium]|nr:hypothetical protein [Myxococcales bacterium]
MKTRARSRLLPFAFASVLGGCVPEAPKPVVPEKPTVLAPAGDAQSAALLSPIAAAAQKAGASELAIVATTLGAEGDRAGAFVAVPPDRCVLFFARGSAGIGDVDIFAFQDDGSSLVSDESSSDQAAIIVCPPAPDRVYVSARIASGTGLIAVGAQQVDKASSAAAARAVSARIVGSESGRLESWPGLESRVVAHRAALGSAWEDVRRFAAAVDARAATRTTVTIEAGRCLDVLVVPSEEVANLEVVAEAEDGRIVARAAAEGRDRSLVLCSELGDTATIAARPRASSGTAAFVIARSQKGALTELSRAHSIDRVTQALSVEGARAALAKELDPTWGKGKAVGAGQAKVGSRASLPVKLPKGCARVDVIAGSPLGPVAAALWDADGNLLAESSGSLRATLYACGAAREVRLDVESRGRVGPFGVDIRSWAEPTSELLKVPLAAARLFERLAGSGDTTPEPARAANGIDLAPSKLHASSFVISPNGCKEVLAAVDAGGSGLEVRLVDEASGDDAIGRGRFVASQRLCAGSSPRRTRLELRLDAGPARALVLIREAK